MMPCWTKWKVISKKPWNCYPHEIKVANGKEDVPPAGAAAGYYARALMVRHKFKDALTVLKDIIGKKYGTYELMDNYGDNFREGPAYENNTGKPFRSAIP